MAKDKQNRDGQDVETGIGEAGNDEVEEAEVVEAEEVVDGEVIEAESVDDVLISDTRDEELEQLKNQVLRLQADYQNYQRRTARERENLIQYANENLMVKLLDVVDNFERALQSEKEKDAFFDGMGLIHRQLISALEASGLEEVPGKGEDFDPNLHNAVISEENDEFKTGQVIEVLQKGYRLNGKVIRPAMVKVAK